MQQGPQAFDKTLTRSPSMSTMTAMAKNQGKNLSVLNEWMALCSLIKDGVRTVVREEDWPVFERQQNGPPLLGFTMKNIDGPHSKTDKDAFSQELALYYNGQKPEQAAQCKADIEALAAYLSEHSIGDFQVMLELATGKLYVLDPTFVKDEPGDLSQINRWNKILTGEIKNLPKGKVTKYD